MDKKEEVKKQRRELDAAVSWTHWHESCPPLGAAECIIIKKSSAWWRKLCRHTVKILDDEGCVRWVRPNELLEKEYMVKVKRNKSNL